MTALLISHSFAHESTEHLTGCGKQIWKFCGNVKTYYMQKIASHCKLICSQIDKTVSSTNISGMLFCCKKKVNQGWQNCWKKQQCILFLGLWLKACVTASWLCCDCSLHNNDIWNILSVHSFVGLTVNYFFSITPTDYSRMPIRVVQKN